MYVLVVLEGLFVGYISVENVFYVIFVLRVFKVILIMLVLCMSEIFYIYFGGEYGLFLGLYIFYGFFRLMRLVK